MAHKVHNVTEGTRVAIVAHFLGADKRTIYYYVLLLYYYYYYKRPTCMNL